jgi:hypothetical protein
MVMAERPDHDSFFPAGAIASFIAMILFYTSFWFALYFLMVYRG